MSAIAIDTGFGYTKVIFGNANKRKKIIFPSITSRFIPTRSFGDTFEVISVNGEPFVVGTEVAGSASVALDFIGSNEYLAIIAYALKLGGFPKKLMVLGVPPQFYESDKLSEIEESIKRMDARTADGTRIRIPRKIEFVPQGLGIFFTCVTDGMGISKDATVVVLDIGYYTLDMVLVSKGRYVLDMARSYPVGMRTLYSKIRDAYAKKYNIFLCDTNDNVVEHIIRKGGISHLDTVHTLDVTSILNNFYFHTVKKSITDYAIDARKKGFSVDCVIIGGGGVSYLGEVKGAFVVNDPQFANARGFFEYGILGL